MYKSLIVLCVVYCVVIEARPKWQVLPAKPGYVPVYIRPGDTPLEEINLELAEAFHEIPAGRSAGKEVEASPVVEDIPEQSDQPQQVPELPEVPKVPQVPKVSEVPKVPEVPEDIIDRRPYEKKILEKKKKFSSEIAKPVERR